MMSQRIVTECDECLTLGESKTAVTIGVQALGVVVEVDLCDVHVKPIADLMARLGEVGRTPGEVGGARVVCPRCGSAFATGQALGRHVSKVHGETLREAREAVAASKPIPKPTAKFPHVCPECGAQFDRPNTLGAHRNRKHGIPGASKDAKARREAAAASAAPVAGPSGE